MEDWNKFLGVFTAVSKKSMETNITNYLKLLAVRQIEILINRKRQDIGADSEIFDKFLNYEETYNIMTYVKIKDGPAKPVYEYLGEEKCYEMKENGVDKQGKMKYKKGKVIPGKFEQKMKAKTDYASFNSKNKAFLNYIISHYFHIIHLYYMESEYEFPEASNFHAEMLEYMKIVSPQNHCLIELFNFKTEELLDSVYPAKDNEGNDLLDSHNVFEITLFQQIKNFFVHPDTGDCNEEILYTAISYITKFLKYIAQMMGNYVFDKKKTINEQTFCMFLRMINITFQSTNIDARFDEGAFRIISKYVAWVPEKVKKDSDKNNTEEYDDQYGEAFNFGDFNDGFDF